MFYPMSKLQKKDHARILRSNLPPEIQKRLAVRAAEDRHTFDQAADNLEALNKALAAEYERTRPARIKAAQISRFYKNGKALS